MLRLGCAAALGLLLGSMGWAWAQESEGIRQPERLTVGVGDQFLGQVTPDGKELLFLSNRNVIREVFHQDLESGQARLLFDEGSDISWARVSPDGRLLLYISYRDDAAGQLCVRQLQDLRESRRRCLSDGARAVEAQWLGPQQIILLSRASPQSNLRVLQVTVGAKLVARPLLDRNLTNPAVSPDGRWLVYVPVERYVERIGPGFAARAAQRLEVVRLGRDVTPHPLVLELPGWTGQPAFSLDGRSLYFTQFYTDSNHDGVVDAGDNGVLFRLPFASDADDAPARAAKSVPQQLTDSGWNCQYPTPAAGQLITTCSRADALDIYGLPLEGVLPESWDTARLQLEIDLSSRAADQQILYRYLLARQSGAAERRQTLTQLIYLHLEVDEFDVAEFYAQKLAAASDPVTAGLEAPLQVQIAHRRAIRARERGRLSLDFVEESRARLKALDPERLAGPSSPAAQALRRIVRSEIADALGDKDDARKELESVQLTGVEVAAVLEAFHRRADALYRELDDAAALFEAARRLSEHPSLGMDDRLRYARAAARALVRGLPLPEARALIQQWRAKESGDSEVAFALELTQTILNLREDKKIKAERDALVALYKRQSRLDRRRAVMLEAVQRANELDAERLVEALVQMYVDDIPKGTRERRRAERVYQRFMEGRAYRRLAAGRLERAREDFAQVARTTGSLESHIGYIDLRLREGMTPDTLLAEYEQRDADYSQSAARFARAYLLSLKLPALDDKQHEVTARQVLALLRQGGAAFKGQATVRALQASVMFGRYLRTGRLSAAQRADAHYLIALELTRRNPRYRALVLSQLELLHSQVGNYRIALGFIKEREKLPILPDARGVLHHLVKARTLLHLSRDEEAAKAAETALTLTERGPELAPYRVLALDRAALYNLSAGRFARALALYDAELPLVLAGAGQHASARNQLVVRLARAAAALGASKPQQALTDLAVIDKQLLGSGLTESLRWPHTPAEEVLRAYRLLAAGLRARAHRSLGELDAAARALGQARELIKQRLAKSKLDEDVEKLALLEAQLAQVAAEHHDAAGAGRWVRSALSHADAFVRRTGVPLSADQLALLWFAAELWLTTGNAPGLELPQRLRAAYAQLEKESDPKWQSYARLLEIYIALLPQGKR